MCPILTGERRDNIGHLGEAEMRGALHAVRATLAELGIADCGRARALAASA